MQKLFLILISTLFLGGCSSIFKTPKPEIVVKRHYVRVNPPKPPIECDHDWQALEKLPDKSDINIVTADSAVQRRGRLDDREIAKVCQSYVKKLARK